MEFRSANAFRGRRILSAADDLSRARTYGSGRVCAVPGCGTVLSAYNPSEVCALHSGAWHDEVRQTTRKLTQREELTRRCAFEPCSREFTTTNPTKKYCGDACRMRAFQARVMAARRMSEDAVAQERRAS
jgi:hypothetical protein